MNRMRCGKWWGVVLLLSLASACTGGRDGNGGGDGGITDAGTQNDGGTTPTCSQELTGIISTEKTLGGDCAHWVVNQRVFVEAGGRLIILPGTTLTFNTHAELIVQGALTAEGTADKPILLTGAQKTRGFWNGVILFDTDSAQNVLKYVTVEYAGPSDFNFGNPAALALISTTGSTATTRASLENVTLRETDGYGLYLGYNAILTSFVNNTLTKNTLGAAQVIPETAGYLTPNNTYTGNDKERVVMQWGTVNRDITWNALGVTYRVQDGLSVEAGATLTIAPGTVFEFNAVGAGIFIAGNLKAQGTAAQRILFTGVEKRRGSWQGLNYWNSNSPLNVLEYVTVEYAGSLATFQGEPAAVSLTNTSTSDSSTVAISHSILRESAGYGLHVGDNSKVTGFEGNLLTKNTSGAAAVAPTAVQYLLDTSTYTGNDPGKNLVTVYPTPPLSSAHTWQALGVPYVITEQLQVEGAAGHLTLQPGVRMEFAAEGSLRVAGARLTAVGTADKHIVFTREPDAGANWRGINFHDSDSVDNRLEYVDISYGGSTAYNDAAAPALLSLTTESTGGSSGVWLSSVTLSSTSAHGIWVDTRSGVRSCTSVTFTDVGTHSNTGSCQ